MNFLYAVVFALCLTAILAYAALLLLDWHIHQVVVATLQQITNPPQ